VSGKIFRIQEGEFSSRHQNFTQTRIPAVSRCVRNGNSEGTIIPIDQKHNEGSQRHKASTVRTKFEGTWCFQQRFHIEDFRYLSKTYPISSRNPKVLEYWIHRGPLMTMNVPVLTMKQQYPSRSTIRAVSLQSSVYPNTTYL